MGGAYFVSRSELLQWLNSTLHLDYTKLEMAANGAAFCQIIDRIYPGKGTSFRLCISSPFFLSIHSSYAQSEF